jgi:phospholipid/cholesterol/gamma-HCH transport system substrate-binding protein
MEERILQFRIGAVVICAGAITIILVLVFGDASPFRGLYQLALDTDSAPGVSQNTPVRKNGILIGRVDSVEQLDNGAVRLGLNIYEGQKIFDGEVFQIGSASLLGDAVIDVVPGEGPRGALLQDGSFIPKQYVAVKVDPMKAMEQVFELAEPAGEAFDAVKRAGNSIDLAAQDVRTIAKTLQQAMGDENSDLKQIMSDFRNMADKAEMALDNFNSMMVNVNDVMGDPQVKLDIKQSIRDFPAITAEAKQAVADARMAIQRLDALGIRVDKNFENLEGFTEALGKDGPEIVRGLRNSMDGVDELIEQITLFSTALNESEGTIGRLIRDPQMYDDLSQTIRNARDISARLKPLVNDLRLITDTISRNPFKLGVPGILDRDPGGRPKAVIPSSNVPNQYYNSPNQQYNNDVYYN